MKFRRIRLYGWVLDLRSPRAETVRQVEKLLRKHGWRCARVVGSHRQWTHPDHPYVVTVPGPPGTRDEVERNACEAVAAHVELLRDTGRPVPEPTRTAV